MRLKLISIGMALVVLIIGIIFIVLLFNYPGQIFGFLVFIAVWGGLSFSIYDAIKGEKS